MSQDFPLMVPGANSTSQPVSVTAPYDDTHIATIATGDSSTVDKALATAERLYKDRKAWLPIYRRVEILEKPKKSWPGAPKSWPSRRRVRAVSR